MKYTLSEIQKDYKCWFLLNVKEFPEVYYVFAPIKHPTEFISGPGSHKPETYLIKIVPVCYTKSKIK